MQFICIALKNGFKGEAVPGDVCDTVAESLMCTAFGLTTKEYVEKTSKKEALSFSLLRKERKFSLSVSRGQKAKLCAVEAPENKESRQRSMEGGPWVPEGLDRVLLGTQRALRGIAP